MNENNPNQFTDALTGKVESVEDEAPYWRRQAKWPLSRVEWMAFAVGAAVVLVFVWSVGWRLIT